MRLIWNKFHPFAFAAVFAAAAFFRFWAAPLSTGPDVAQFWAFARVFQMFGIDFYHYADGVGAIFPTQGWGFFYPTGWLLILRLCLLATPTSLATDSAVDVSWRLAEKTPIILADLAIGALIYWAVPGSKFRKLLFASLWLFLPTAWYNSAVFGQFDAIAATFLLASIIVLERGKDRLAFLLAGLAVITKQHTLIPIALMIAVSARHMSKQRLLSNCSIIAGIVILVSIPFLLTGNIGSYARSLFLGIQAPGYQDPLMYAFNGSGALLTYLHNLFDWDTSSLFQANIPLLVVALIAAIAFSCRKPITPAQAALVGFLIFIGLFYRVNYQYLIVYIPLALLVAAKTHYKSERAFTLVLALLPLAWMWLFDVSMWFNYLKPVDPWIIPLFDRIGLARTGTPDYAFVTLALVLMSLSLTYAVCAFVRWRNKEPIYASYPAWKT